MFHKTGIGIMLGIMLLFCFFCMGPDKRDRFVRESLHCRACLLECFHTELARGGLGGISLNRLSESLSTATVITPGIWDVPVFDPDERCWYLTGWISDGRIGDWRFLLTIFPERKTPQESSWRFHLRCTDRNRNGVPPIELEGGWRNRFDLLRIVYKDVSGNDECPNLPWVHLIHHGRDISRYPATSVCPEG